MSSRNRSLVCALLILAVAGCGKPRQQVSLPTSEPGASVMSDATADLSEVVVPDVFDAELYDRPADVASAFTAEPDDDDDAGERASDIRDTIEEVEGSAARQVASRLPAEAPPAVTTAERPHGPRTVMVELDARRMRAEAEAERRRRGIPYNDERILSANRDAIRQLRDGVAPAIKDLGLTIATEYRNSPVLAVEIRSETDLVNLKAIDGVIRVNEVHWFRPNLSESLPHIGQPAAVAAGHTGDGVAVAILDNGIDLTEFVFGPCSSAGNLGCHVAAAATFVEAPPADAEDEHAHGSNVAGIVLGVAPDVKLIDLNIAWWDEDEEDWRTNEAVVCEAISWIIDHAVEDDIVAFNLSYGDDKPHGSDCGNDYSTCFQDAVDAGVQPVVSSGNGGSKKGIGAPACDANAVSVGMVFDTANGGVTWYDETDDEEDAILCTDTDVEPDDIPCSSQSASNLDLLAPGYRITAGGLTGGTMSGTSMAAPHVAGAWAILRAAFPKLSNAGVLDLIRDTGVSVTDPANGVATPRLELDWGLTYGEIAGKLETGDRFGAAVAAGDYNGDGFADLAVGAPDEDVGWNGDAGAVVVLYGSASGAGASTQFINQDDNGVSGKPELGDHFGFSLAAGDFNGDGVADLAVGTPYEDVDGEWDVGMVHVLYGSKEVGGLVTGASSGWHQASTGIPGGAEMNDNFGYALAAGDFDGDGRDDLAVGVPGDDVGDTWDAGMVNILYGGAIGISATGAQLFHQGTDGILGGPELGDNFGHALAAGDFDNDKRDDLAIGVPSEDVGDTLDAGAVNVIYGANTGLTAKDSQIWHQGKEGIKGKAEADDRFGWSLAAGRLGGYAFDDLAIGIPNEDLSWDKGDAGAVAVLHGSKYGLSATDQIWHQAKEGVHGAAEGGDRFGASLTIGDFDGDGRGDLAIGVPNEDVDGLWDPGAVNVLYGTATYLSAADDDLWHQNDDGIGGVSDTDDHFGWCLAAGDVNGDGRSDLCIGVPDEDSGWNGNAGALNLLRGGASGLSATGSQALDQASD